MSFIAHLLWFAALLASEGKIGSRLSLPGAMKILLRYLGTSEALCTAYIFSSDGCAF